MFNIIEPNDHQTYQSRVDSFLTLLKIYQNLSIPSEELENATFIIASDNEQGVYGGALLLQQNVFSFERKIRQTILTFQPNVRSVWTGVLGFYKEHEGPYATVRTLESSLDFYSDLLKAFIEFGNKKDLHFLSLILSPLEYVKIKNQECWEYVIKVLPQNSLDGLFHGILSLGVHKIERDR